MAYKRPNGFYYTDREYPLVGRVARSLQTRSQQEANLRESVLMSLGAANRADLLEAWADGRLGIESIVMAHRAGKLDALQTRPDGVTLKEACRACLRSKSPDVSENTYRVYRVAFGHVRRILGDETPVTQALTTDAVQEVKRVRLEEDDVKKNTVNTDLGALSVLATFAQGKGWVRERPEIKKFSTAPRVRYLSPQQYQDYVEAAQDKYRPLYVLMLGTGLRISEALTLRVSDLRLGDSRILLPRSKTASGVRRVFMTSEAREAVEGWIEREGLGGDDRLFGGEGFDRTNVTKRHQTVATEIGLHDYVLHDHRHTFAVMAAKNGMPLHLLQKQLGHSDIQQTMKYADFHPDYSDVERYFDRIEADMNGVAAGS